jgi:hypothetical protein
MSFSNDSKKDMGVRSSSVTGLEPPSSLFIADGCGWSIVEGHLTKKRSLVIHV